MLNNLSNFFNIITGKMIKKVPANDDLIALGTRDPRYGGGYKPTAITVGDLIQQTVDTVCAKDTLKTGIYDNYPWIITPAMLPTCTRVEDTPAFPTMFAGNLVGYKVSGTYDLSENNIFLVDYIGTVENVNGNPIFGLPWKTAGSVGSFVNVPFPSPFVSAFANGATIEDDNGDAVPAELMTIAVDFYAPDAADLYLVVASNTAVDAMYATISFENEFLDIEGETLKFTQY